MTDDDNAPSFKYRVNLIGNTETNGTKKEVKIAVPLKYLSKFWRSLKMQLIICKVELSFKWTGNCVLTTAAIGANANAKLYVPIVKLSAEDNAKVTKLLGEGFKRYIYSSEDKVTDNILVQIAALSEEK